MSNFTLLEQAKAAKENQISFDELQERNQVFELSLFIHQNHENKDVSVASIHKRVKILIYAYDNKLSNDDVEFMQLLHIPNIDIKKYLISGSNSLPENLIPLANKVMQVIETYELQV